MPRALTPIERIERMQSLVDHWPGATSLDAAFIDAGINLKDRRARMRLRRKTEEHFGITLEPHNPQNSTEHEALCPSTLDIVKAKAAKGIITVSYTNNTKLEDKFLDTLEVFAEAKGLQILVKPIRYKNPNAMEKAEPYHWDKRIIPYAINDDFHLNSSLVFSAVSLQATVANPLAGKQIAYGNKSVVYGSSAIELDAVATPKGELPKLLFATGSLNKAKYSNSDAGIKSMARHNNTAIIFIPHNDYNRDYILEWDGEGFSFFKEYWTPEGMAEEVASYDAIHFGDAHAEGMTKAMITQRMRMVELLDPATLVWNDLHNHGAGSHHNDLIEALRRERRGLNSVEAEVQKAIDVLNTLGKGRKNIIVRSNHHDHLQQWVDRFKPKQDLANADYYAWLMYKNTQDDTKSFLELAMEDSLTVEYEFINGDGAYNIAGIDCSQHGDKGADGARTAVGFHKLSRKLQTGHSHKRFIKGLHWSSAVIPLELGYNKGYGTWSSTDTAITTEGTRAHITFIKGKFWK